MASGASNNGGAVTFTVNDSPLELTQGITGDGRRFGGITSGGIGGVARIIGSSLAAVAASVA